MPFGVLGRRGMNKNLGSQTRGRFKDAIEMWRPSFMISVSVRDGSRVARRWASIDRNVVVIVVYRRST